MPVHTAVSPSRVATLTLDDGKVNALDLDALSRLDEALDGCGDAAAVVLAGRDGVFSAGLHTGVLASGDEDAIAELLTAFGRTVLRLWTEPRPTVAAVTGHAPAGGTIIALACDHAVAAQGAFGWGLTETTLGFPLPRFVIALARANVPADRLEDLLLPGTAVDPGEAVRAGFADELVPGARVVETAVARATALSRLPRAAYAATKARLRLETAAAALAGLDGDVRRLLDERKQAP